jgi:UDPglucose 6-dehydrogenase
MAQDIAVIGTGYVGLVTAVGLADFGNTVVGVDLNERIVESLNHGVPTIYEHGIEDYLKRNLESKRLSFTQDIATAVEKARIVFLAVGTPPLPDGGADLSQIENAARSIADHLNDFKSIVTKSTVPVGTNRRIREVIAGRLAENGESEKSFAVVSNPEFLREGRAVQDFFHPDRIVIGYETDTEVGGRAREALEDVYRSLYLIQTPFVWCNLDTAELIKYASNAFLATKITFINQMANLAEATGADIHAVAQTMGKDGRISPKFLHPGPGYGGSCFPKDTKALAATGVEHGVQMSLIEEVIRANETQKARVAEKLERSMNGLSGKTVAMLGLAFKSETDDVRESPAITIAEEILKRGGKVHAHDPKGMENFKELFGERISFCASHRDAFTGADAILIVTEWNEYRGLDLAAARAAMSSGDGAPLIFDTRNVLDPEDVKSAGFRYLGTGRG